MGVRFGFCFINQNSVPAQYANGFAAYDAWIKDLENEETYSKMDKEQFAHYWHVIGNIGKSSPRKLFH